MPIGPLQKFAKQTTAENTTFFHDTEKTAKLGSELLLSVARVTQSLQSTATNGNNRIYMVKNDAAAENLPSEHNGNKSCAITWHATRLSVTKMS